MVRSPPADQVRPGPHAELGEDPREVRLRRLTLTKSASATSRWPLPHRPAERTRASSGSASSSSRPPPARRVPPGLSRPIREPRGSRRCRSVPRGSARRARLSPATLDDASHHRGPCRFEGQGGPRMLLGRSIQAVSAASRSPGRRRGRLAPERRRPCPGPVFDRAFRRRLHAASAASIRPSAMSASTSSGTHGMTPVPRRRAEPATRRRARGGRAPVRGRRGTARGTPTPRRSTRRWTRHRSPERAATPRSRAPRVVDVAEVVGGERLVDPHHVQLVAAMPDSATVSAASTANPSARVQRPARHSGSAR